MTDDGIFIRALFRRQTTLNIFALVIAALAPVLSMAIAGAYFGSAGLAIIAICAPLFLVASFLGFIISGGAQILCARHIAHDDTENSNKVYSAAVLLTLFAATLLCAALLLFRPQILILIAGEISYPLSAYYTFFVINVFFTMLAYVPMFFARAAGRPGIAVILTVILTVTGTAASLVLLQFIGISAIAAGQAIGTFLGFATAMMFLRRHYTLKFHKKLYIKEIFAKGSPVGLTRFYIFLTTLALNTLFLRIGGLEAVAVYGVVATLHRFNVAIKSGVTQTLTPLVGVFHEEQDMTSIRQTMRLAFIYGNALIIASGVLLNIFHGQIAAVFGLDGALGAIMPYYSVYALLLVNTMILTAYYNAAKMLTLANIIPFLQEFAIICTAAYAIAFFLGNIWLAFPISGIVTLALFAAILWVSRNKNLTFFLRQSRQLEKGGRYVSFSVEYDPIKASDAAAKISDFCEKDGMPPKQTMLISMSVEEIIGLIIANSKSKHNSVSVRLFLLNDNIILRFRFAGEKFDATEFYKTNIAVDAEKMLDVAGMTYIMRAANVIYYRQTFGVNNLVVII